GVRTLLGHGGSTLPSTRTPSHLRYATRSHFTRSIAVAKSDASKSSRNARSGDPSKRAANEKAIKEAEAQERHKMKAQKLGNPSWFVPVMLGLMRSEERRVGEGG